MKSLKYREAIIAATIKKKLDLNVNHQVLSLVLGAGRGPLVDRSIDAIKTMCPEWLDTESKKTLSSLQDNY